MTRIGKLLEKEITLDQIVKAAIEIMKPYCDRTRADHQCSVAAEAFRYVLYHFSIEASLASAYIKGDIKGGHDFVVVDGEVIDFTMNQFFKKEQKFPYRLKVDSPKFKKLFTDYKLNDESWDWKSMGADNQMVKDIIAKVVK